jgi:hypothetical protein
MLLLLILPVWALGLLLVVGLCFTARLGDSEQDRLLAAEQAKKQAIAVSDGRRVPASAPSAERAMQAPLRREIAA